VQQVKIEVPKLLEILRKNREAHHAVFMEAMDGYRKAAIASLDRSIADAKAGKRIRQSIGLIEPQNMTDSYDQEIQMLELSVDGTVTLTGQEFRQYVRDDWSWKGQFSVSNRAYVVSDAGKKYLGTEDDE
jgi:hypothetical protein